jgi:hypothetical protein
MYDANRQMRVVTCLPHVTAPKRRHGNNDFSTCAQKHVPMISEAKEQCVHPHDPEHALCLSNPQDKTS